MEALTYLCEQGGDPTILSSDGRTPKNIVEENNCEIAAALLGIVLLQKTLCIYVFIYYIQIEILELIHSKKSKRFPVPEYADIDAMHKTILHWLVMCSYIYIVVECVVV